MGKAIAVFAIFLVAAGLFISLSLTKAAQPKSKNSTDSKEVESIRVRYARAHLELARLDLRQVEDLNKTIPNLVPAGTVEEFRRHVAVDEEQLKQHLKGEKADLREISIRMAETEVANSEADLKRQQAIHDRMPTHASAHFVERAAVVARLAKLSLEKARSQDSSDSALAHMKLELEDLRNEVLELQRNQVLALQPK